MSAALRRGATFAAGLVILCFGIVLNTKTGLGVASINTAPYTFSQVEGISLGTATMLLYFIFAGAQCLLRRSLGWKIILQIPMSVLIGRIVDFFNDYVLTFQAKGLADGLLLCHPPHCPWNHPGGPDRSGSCRPGRDGAGFRRCHGVGFWPRKVHL